ncbi:MAG: DUF4296 domain-containing protein [Chitinophagaceae bacterium]|nr:MAG: DUF4296 domain-containing protein [Chitinophagaceae bacterium]
MKKLSFPLLLLLTGIMACSDKNKLPKDVLPQPKMQAVMWDMIRAGDFLNNYVFYRDTSVDKIAETQKWNEKIFRIHKITRDQFDKSYAYYRQHPQLMKAVMDSISKTKVEDIVTQPTPEPVVPSVQDTAAGKRKLDSLKRVRRIGKFNNRLNNKLAEPK